MSECTVYNSAGLPIKATAQSAAEIMLLREHIQILRDASHITLKALKKECDIKECGMCIAYRMNKKALEETKYVL